MVDLENPYAPPADVGAIVAPAHSTFLVDVSKGRRFLHWIVDTVLIQVILVILMFGGAVDVLRQSSIASYASTMATSLVYYVFFESVFGRTPGKFLTGSRVVGLDGGRPSFGALVIRSLVRFVPFDGLSFIPRLRTGWHDEWSRTRVVPIR